LSKWSINKKYVAGLFVGGGGGAGSITSRAPIPLPDPYLSRV